MAGQAHCASAETGTVHGGTLFRVVLWGRSFAAVGDDWETGQRRAVGDQEGETMFSVCDGAGPCFFACCSREDGRAAPSSVMSWKDRELGDGMENKQCKRLSKYGAEKGKAQPRGSRSACCTCRKGEGWA